MKDGNIISFTESRKAERVRNYFEEYRRLARLVDDLDIRFWKRFILRESMREKSIDRELSEDNLRREYRKCVADLVRRHSELYASLDTVVSTISRELILEYYVRDISLEMLEEKWGMPKDEIMAAIRTGLSEADVPERKPVKGFQNKIPAGNAGESGVLMKKCDYSKQKESFLAQVGVPGKECTVTRKEAKSGDVNIMEYSVRTGQDCESFRDLSTEEQKKALAWIRANVFHRKTPLESRTSYGMKHLLEHRTNIYVTNNAFKELMLICGFYPVKVDALNWWFCVSAKSPAFVRLEDGREGLMIPECVMDYGKRKAIW